MGYSGDNGAGPIVSREAVVVSPGARTTLNR